MSENTNEVMNEAIEVEAEVLTPEVSSEPIIPEQKIVLPTTTSFGQAMVNTATTMVAGAIIGAGLNALAAGANKALRSGGKWVKKKIEAKKEAKALKKAEEQALKELAEEVTPDNESTN